MTSNALKVLVRQMAGTDLKDPIHGVLCTVDSVNEADCICDCTPIGGDATTQIPSVALNAETSDGFTIIPTVGSTVLVEYSYQSIARVAMFSEIDKLKVFVQDPITKVYTSYFIENGLQQFNDGSFGGLVQVIKLTQKLNNLETLVNQILAGLQATTVVIGSGGGSYPLAPNFTETPLTPTQRADIENSKITHGK